MSVALDQRIDYQKVAAKIREWMATELDSKDGDWIVDSHHFLPANVMCDRYGIVCFEARLASQIEKAVDLQFFIGGEI